MLIAFGSEFWDTRKNPTEQGIISTLTLALMLICKIFLYWFSSNIENSMEPEFSSTNRELPQLEAGDGVSTSDGYQVTEDWNVTPLTPSSGRVIITELEGRDSRTGWSGRVSRASHLTWGSHQGLSVGASRGLGSSPEDRGVPSGWGSQTILPSSREGRGSRSEVESQSQSVRTSREAISTVSSTSGWTTASARDSRLDLR